MLGERVERLKTVWDRYVDPWPSQKGDGHTYRVDRETLEELVRASGWVTVRQPLQCWTPELSGRHEQRETVGTEEALALLDQTPDSYRVEEVTVTFRERNDSLRYTAHVYGRHRASEDRYTTRVSSTLEHHLEEDVGEAVDRYLPDDPAPLRTQ